MNRLALVAAMLALTIPGIAQEDFETGEVSLGIMQTDSDTISSKFLEYRDLPEGAVAPSFRFHGKSGTFRYDLQAFDVSQEDQRYSTALRNDVLSFEAQYYRVPHSFGNGGKSILTRVGEDAFLLSDSVQQSLQSALEAQTAVSPGGINYDFLSALVQPSLSAASLVDLKLSRERANASFSITPAESPVAFEVVYFRERRTGTRAASGTAFGFGNVVETPEPLHYLTQDFGLQAVLDGSWGVGRAAVHFNDFKSRIPFQTFDNPFRFTDSTDASAYQAPGSRSIGGASVGLISLAPDNKAITGSVGATFKIGDRNRLSLDAGFGTWRQDSTELIPYTTNTSIVTPSGLPATTAPLPTDTLDGQIDRLSLSGYFTSRLSDDLRFTARYRHYDHDNKTPRIRFEEGYVRFDGVWEEIPRITVPFGYTNDRFDAGFSYDLEPVTLEAGYTFNRRDRTFRETEQTTENGLVFKADVRPSDVVLLRGTYEMATRDFDEYDAVHAEEQSFLPPHGDPANHTLLRRYDQAKRDLQRFGASLELSPGGSAMILLSYMKTKHDYDDSPVLNVTSGGMEAPLGLQQLDYETFSAEVDFAPTDRANLYAFYTRENMDDFLSGRQSAATLSTNPLDGWTSMVADRVDSLGFGADFVLVPDVWNLNVFGRYQQVDGQNDLFSPPGGAPDTARSVELFDDTEQFTAFAKLSYQLARSWLLSFGGFFEDYDIRDAQTEGLLNYMPGSLFLAANNEGYKAFVGFVNLRYTF
jgi:MtrB/PioB family decaheme-associated outer membrane protein